MKVVITLLSILILPVYGQTADQIIAKYHQNSGGRAAWTALRNVKMSGKVLTDGRVVPVRIIQTSSGQQKVDIRHRGRVLTQMSFDGQQGWDTDFSTEKTRPMTAGKVAAMKQQVLDFPDALLNYRKNGHQLRYAGRVVIDGRESHKLSLTRRPVRVDGQFHQHVTHYFFDPESYLLLGMESTSRSPATRGMTVLTLLDDYRTVDGLLFPFASRTSYDGRPGEGLVLDKIETNVSLDPAVFTLPE